MYPTLLLILAGAAAAASSSPSPSSSAKASTSTSSASSSSPSCFDFTASVHINAPSYSFLDFTPFADGYQAVEFLLETYGNRSAPSNPNAILGPTHTVNATFAIDSTYCVPSTGGNKSSTVQLLTHGLGFDKSYWNFGNASYNYILSATRAGYSTLSYSRLGCGLSSRPDAYSVIQTQIELAVLTQLTTLLRTGKLNSKIPIPQKVVHVGHSFGSVLSNALGALTPSLSDALVLTGFTLNTTWQQWFYLNVGYNLAKENQPAKFANYSTGDLTWPNKYNNQFGFFKYPYFDPAVLETAEATKQPLTIGELLTSGAVPAAPSNFTGKILYVAAENDLIFCGGQCNGVVNGPTSMTVAAYPKASKLQIYVQPNSGHGLNLHRNASAWYAVVNTFLDTSL